MRNRKDKKTHFVFKLNIFKLLSIFLILLFICFLPLILKTSLKINKVECKTQIGSCPEDIQNYLNTFNGLNYQVVKSNLEKYLNNNYLVENFLIQFKIPKSVIVDLNVKKPTNSLSFLGDNQYFYITSDGIVVEVKDKSELLNVVINNNKLYKTYKFGDKVDEEILYSVKILNYLNYLFGIKEVTIQNEYLNAVSNEGVNILYPKSGDINFLVGSTRLIFSRLNKATEGIRMEEVKEIDLRYKNPILRRK